MAIPDNIQTLTAAFSFGILLQAASGALFIYYKGHGPNILQDGRRLVLVLFLLFAALWAQFGFFNLMLSPTASGPCQALLIFTTIFDQLARVGVEQFFVWALGQGTKATTQQMVLQGILGVRLVAGGVLVGFTRPDFAPTCVARTSVLPTSIVVLALDVIIIGVLMIRASSQGVFSEMGDKRSSTRQLQSRALIFSIAGFTVWTGMSVPMLLGIPTIILILRTTLPANGLLILVGIVTMFQGALLLPREDEVTTPEAQSPFITPAPPAREIFRENVGTGSPVSGHNYTKSGNLFVVNPSLTPRDSPTSRFQGNYQGDTRGFTKLGMENSVRALGGEDQDRPISKNGPGYRGSSGVFPSFLTAPLQVGNQAAMAPQIKPMAMDGPTSVPKLTVPTPAAAAQQKRSLFNWSKSPVKPTVRTLGISQPVMDAGNESVQPFARMPTIDLATAAANERERREGAAARSRLVAQRPAPLPPAQEGLRRSISTKRKEMPNLSKTPMPTIPSSDASGRSVDLANGSSTSASLSPGREEVRRRSPRNMNSFSGLGEERNLSTPPPLQRKGTIGLPSNPRSNRVTMARETGMAKEQTVMFINDIVYDDPGMVNDIISAAPNMYAASKRPKTAEPKLSGDDYKPSPTYSIIHRPRPIRRDSETERAIFPSESSPRHHKRSKSGSSLIGRRSIFMSTPGSPTQLPPLPLPPPPPPTSAARLKKLLPNDTKSMTFDEKIELLFPAPPGAPSIHNRRSSVPSLPRLPSVFMSNIPHVQSPTEEDQQSRRQSKRTTIASFDIPEVPKPEPSRAAERQTYRFSANTYRNLADQVGETWIPGISPAHIDIRNSVQENPKPEPAFNARQKSTWTETTASVSSFNDDATTFWGSLHSEFQPVDLSRARQTAKATLVQQGGSQPREDNSRALPPLPPLPTEFNDGDEIMTVMLDDGEGHRPILSESGDNRRSFLLDIGQTLPGDKTPSPQTASSWHRRIGDELPTFSERKVQARSRKMPPPTPLLLSKNGRKATVVIRNTEPSPIDSPERAIQEIQEQLKRFEEPSRGSVGSIIRHLPNGSSAENNETPDDHGFKLLENLEKEMGLQENQWQKMQTNIDRDSMSTVTTAMSPAAPSPQKTDISRTSSQRSSRTPSRVLSRRARIRSSMARSKGEDSTSTTSTSSSDNSRASIWQQRLAEAQEEYLEKAPVLLRKRSLNFLSVSKSHQLGSPTPPDSGESETDLETESESESEVVVQTKQDPPQTIRKDLSLWRPSPGSPKMAAGRLWNPPYENSTARSNSPEPPAKNIRPVQRLTANVLSISSSYLWSKPRSAEHSRPVVGLWGSKLVRPRSIITRPVTQRPQRKSKRVTFLPDIVESPVPLPNKRETLGIFQFPWGEKSDSAVYQPAFNPALISAPIVNARLDARSRQLEPDLSEYSESFFDDYDEEQDDLDIDSESDDDFDETTLWEIASLLNSRDVPSKNSLLPPSREIHSREIIEDYDEDTDFESETEEQDSDESMAPINVAQAPATKFPIQPLARASKETSLLWTGIPASTASTTTVGLPQPEEKVWKSLVPATDDIARSKPRASESLPALTTNDLWTISLPETVVPSSASMWSTASISEKSLATVPAREELMWQAPQKIEDVRSTGLFTATDSQTIIRTTTVTPAAINMVKAPRSSTEALPTIASQSLWSRDLSPVQQKEWTSKPATVVSEFAATMWMPSKKEAETAILGLFNVSASRSDYRVTTLKPAAIAMTCKPRTSRAPLSRLTSSKLWRRCEGLVEEHHWISESSIRPESPSIYSSASSGQSSPASDASSVKSTSTKASSLWGSIGSAATAIPSWWEPNSAKKSPSRSPVDESKHPSKIPLRQPAAKPLEPVIEEKRESKIPTSVKHLVALRESRVLVSRDLAETKAPVLESTPMKKFRRSVLPQKTVTPAHKPIRHQHRPILAFRANWEEALAEAIAAGTSKKTLTRQAVSRDDWATALSAAISKSQPRVQRINASPEMWQAALAEAVAKSIVPASLKTAKYESAVRHPVFFTENMATSTSQIHPAAIVHVSIPVSDPRSAAKYDPSVRHPVFFTEKLTTNTTQIHPAAIGHVSVSARLMWTNPSVAKAPRVTALWSKETAARRQTPVIVSGLSETIRKAPAMRALDLPALESSEFWKPTRQNISERHWLNASKAKSAQTWVPTLEASSANEIVNSSLWSAQKPTRTGSPDMFAHVRGESTKKAPTPRKVVLPLLQTTELFGSHSSAEPSATHWLHTTSRMTESPAAVSPSKPRIQGLTWTPGLVEKKTENEMKMWESQSKDAVRSPTLFSNPHTAPWEQKKRQPVPLKTIESTKMWAPSMAIPLSPKNWLVKRKFSKVEFRY